MLLIVHDEAVETRPRRAFVSYSHTQTEWKERVVAALSGRNGDSQIAAWHDGKLLPGQAWDNEIRAELDRADVVLLLVSRAFLSSEYCRDVELQRALERAGDGDALLIPVLLETCDWKNEPFARYQALPLNGVPLDRTPDVKAALDDCREKLDLACLGHWYPRRPRPGTGDRGVWRLTVRAPSSGSIDWKRVVRAMRDMAVEPDIEFLGVLRPVADEVGDGLTVGIYDGPAKAFLSLESAHMAGSLSTSLGVDVITISLVPGALIHAGTDVVDWSTQIVEVTQPLLGRTQSFEPPRLFGLVLRPSEPDWLLPLNTMAGNTLSDDEWDIEKRRLLGYFFTSLALPGEDMHVNLSAYERNRIMPRTLAQTPLGQVLAEQDCLLKHFVSSLLHPDSPTGREFWPSIRKAAKRYSGNQPIDLWQKVWIVAGSATAQQKDAGEPYNHPLPPGFEIRDSDWLGWISECRMNVMCETDYTALQQYTSAAPGAIESQRAVNGEFLDVFRDTILPVIEAEVNEGALFAPLRQAFWGVTLAKWYRENIYEKGIHSRLAEIAEQMRLEWAGSDGVSSPSPEIGLDDDAPEWLNRCFERYMDLLSGVFRCVRAEPEGVNATPVRRLYYSGGVIVAADRATPQTNTRGRSTP